MRNKIVLIAVAMCMALFALACGGGGAGSSSDSTSGTLLKAQFAANKAYEGALQGDTLVIYKLGETTPSFKKEKLSDISEMLTVSFESGNNYIFTVERLGVNFLGTIITSQQISSALNGDRILKIGELNAVTTFLAHEIDPKTWDKSATSAGKAVSETLAKYSNAKDFSELKMADMRMPNSNLMTPLFRAEVTNRANAMTGYANVLRAVAASPNPSIADKNAMNRLHVAILTGGANTWLEVSKKVQPELDDYRDPFRVRFQELSEKLFLPVGNEYVIDANDLYNIFFDPVLAETLYVYNLAVETPSSVISGTITGDAVSGTMVYLQRKAAGNSAGYVTESATTDSTGAFSFKGLAPDQYQLIPQKPGVFFKSLSDPIVSGNTIRVSITSFELAHYVDNSSIELNSSGNLSVKDAGITSAKLATGAVTADKLATGAVNMSILATGAVVMDKLATGAVTTDKLTTGAVTSDKLTTGAVTTDKLATGAVNISILAPGAVTMSKLAPDVTAAIAGTGANYNAAAVAITGGNAALSNLKVAGSANLNGITFPEATSGTTGQVLKLDASKNLVFGNDSSSGYNEATVSIIGGTINGVTVGATTASSGKFTSLTSTGDVNALGSANVAGSLQVGGSSTLGQAHASNIIVTGSTNIRGINFPDITSGAAGQVLKLDGARNLVFSNDTSGGNSYNEATVAIIGGTINNVSIGATTPSTGKFTEVTASSLNVPTSANITGGLVVTGIASLKQLLVTDSANLRGITFPDISTGVAGQILKLDGAKNLVFANDAAGGNAYNESAVALIGGTINGVTIGSFNAASGKFTTLSSTSDLGVQGSANIAGALSVGGTSTLNQTTVSGITIGNSANILGMNFPNASTGAAGQVLKLDGTKNLVFANDASSAYNESAVAIIGGTINGVPVGQSNAAAGKFTDLVASTSANLRGMTVPAVTEGTSGQVLKLGSAGNLYFAADNAGSSSYNEASVAITGGNISGVAINNVAIGGKTGSSGNFTTMTAASLNVTGSTNIRGMTFPDVTSGTAGQVLKLDGSRNLVFGNDSSGGGSYNEATVAIIGGNINGVPVGQTTAASGKFTDFTATTSANLRGMTVPAATEGTSGQVLKLGSAGNLYFAADNTGASAYNEATVAITGGNISGVTLNNTAIGSTSSSSGNFTIITATAGNVVALTASTAANLLGVTFPARSSGTTGNVLKLGVNGNLYFAADNTGATAYNEATVAITGGNINGSAIGGTTAASGNFTTLSGASASVSALTASTSANLLGVTFPAVSTGTAGNILKLGANGNLYFAPIEVTLAGTETLTNKTLTAPAINGGTMSAGNVSGVAINGSNIGTTTAASGNFTTLSATTSANILGVTFPAASTGTAGNILKLGANGNLYFGSVEVTLSGVETLTNKVITAPSITGGTMNTGNVTSVAINSSNIGAITAASGNFTTLTATGAFNAMSSANIHGGLTSNSANIVGALMVGSAANVVGPLHVVGSANISGILYPTVAGSANTFVMSNGSGNLVFSSANQILNNTIISGITLTGATATSANISGATSLSVTGSTNLENSLNVGGNASLSGTLAVTGNTTLSNLTVTGNTVSNSANIVGVLTVGSAANIVGALHVVGSANITGILYPTVAGSTNTFVMSNGSGNLVFSSANQILNNTTMSGITLTSSNISGATFLSVTGSTNLESTLSVAGATNLASTLSAGNTTLSNLTVTGNTMLGSSNTNFVKGGAAGGNVWFAGNLISSTNTYSLGTAASPWNAIYAIDLVTTSDERLKKDIEPLEYGLDAVMKLRPVSYEWNNRENKGRTIGLLAQEVEQVVSEAVSVAGDDQHTRGVRYSNMVPVLIRAIQDQQAVIEAQKKALEDQTLRLERLESALLKK